LIPLLQLGPFTATDFFAIAESVLLADALTALAFRASLAAIVVEPARAAANRVTVSFDLTFSILVPFLEDFFNCSKDEILSRP
jgi:hypothetical protein